MTPISFDDIDKDLGDTIALEHGMAVSWAEGDSYEYGIVWGKDKAGQIMVVPVFGLDKKSRCYDETKSTWEHDRDKVCLRNSFTSFEDLSEMAGRGLCFADANPSRFVPFSVLEACVRLNVLDGGRLLNQIDLATVQLHPWWDELEKGKLFVDDGYDEVLAKEQVEQANEDDEGASLFAAVNEAAEKHNDYFSEQVGQEDVQSGRSVKMQEAFSRVHGGGLSSSGSTTKPTGPSL